MSSSFHDNNSSFKWRKLRISWLFYIPCCHHIAWQPPNFRLKWRNNTTAWWTCISLVKWDTSLRFRISCKLNKQRKVMHLLTKKGKNRGYINSTQMAPSRFMLSSSAGPVLRGHDGILFDIRLSERPKAAYLSYSHLFS